MMRLWRLADASDYRWLPHQLMDFPAWVIDQWCDYLMIKADEAKRRRKRRERERKSKRRT